MAAYDLEEQEQIEELKMERRMQPAPVRPRLPPVPVVSTHALIDLATHLREIEQLKREVARLQGTPRFHVVRYGDTVVLATATMGGIREGDAVEWVAL